MPPTTSPREEQFASAEATTKTLDSCYDKQLQEKNGPDQQQQLQKR